VFSGEAMADGKRIVLNTFGSYGDIHPYMALAMELQSRGHNAVIATSGLYQEKIETAGLEFFPVRPELPPPEDQDQGLIEKIMHPRTGPRFLIEEVIFAALKDSYEDVSRAVVDADLLITHPATPAAPLVGRKTGIPWISTVLAPVSFLSAYDPPVPPFWPWFNNIRILGPRVMKVVHDLIKKTFKAEALVNFRRELGLEDWGHPMFEGQHSRELVLALFSPLFASAQPDWPPQTRSTGFPFYDGHRELEMPGQLERFLEKGQAPIVFTLGSSAVWVAQDFFHESIAAAIKLERRAVLLIGDQRNLPAEPLPESILAVDYAPYQSLLPRASLMVHHGGIGTTSQGLRAGLPTLIVPFAFDQPDNAAHAARLGTSRTLYRKDYRVNRIVKELDVLLSRPQYSSKAKDLGERLRQERGAENACDLIEDFLRKHPRKRSLPENAYALSY
jgi:UDP:flavonoid glycosyltransferase YjiC (YdhE family)